ncbi:hypothetical protein [Cyanobium sp. CH-040]|uniref:hypothetical protein n=1 Tax=Cyanobium sp. CH-040 TaxID=2823708 RepID=UPI0020CD3C35|nr:hypothetical protein [Cyanobium sp. CH-040]MCP9927308.1 hypothetical protein [Cyanobium sp. CH-040]
MVTPLLRTAFLGTGLVLLGFTGSPAHAQTLLDVMGAGAIQNSLQSLPAGGASGVIERSRGSVDQFNQTEQLRLEALQQLSGAGGGGGRGAPAPPAALLGPLMELFGAMGASGAAAGGPQTLTTAQVNGQLVPYCSHGGLCYGSLMRALRRY